MKIPIISGKEMVKFLSKEGFVVVGRRGSHIRMKKITQPRNLVVIIPDHKELAIGTFHAILKQANMKVEDFLKKYKS